MANTEAVSQNVDHSENDAYLTEQILTYLGNKRLLLNNIGIEVREIQRVLHKDKLVTLDLFSGSGIVARYLKQYSSSVYANDLEKYSWIINSCYLSNRSEFDTQTYLKYLELLNRKISDSPIDGVIVTNYAPQNTERILAGERAFYTHENAQYIDSMRTYIDDVIPENYRKYFLARLLIEASIHTNTAGIFKGFYKDKNTGIGKFGGTGENALSRIKGKIEMSVPVLSNFETDYRVYREDANTLVKELEPVDLAYLDPPYNQHPYGSNYFMLNVILDNCIPDIISKVSGIPSDWNHSAYNKKANALNSLAELISDIRANYIIVSYNNEGFITENEMTTVLGNFGRVKTTAIEYNAYRGSRNLRNRNLKTSEYLFVLQKGAG